MINFSLHSPIKTSSMADSDKWLVRFDNLINAELDNPSLNNELIARQMTISERQLFRKVKGLTGVSPQNYVRTFRLEKAMEFLKNGNYRTVKETSYAVGYKNVSYFITQFEQKYNLTPFKILQAEGWR